MQRAKLLAIFTAALMILAATAIPASAWFSATSTQGPANSSGVSTFTNAGNTIACSKWVGAWHIETTGKVLHRQKTEQFLTKEGPHLGLTVSKWEGCFASAGGAVLPTEMRPCILQVEQPTKFTLSGAGTSSIAETCKMSISILGCEMELPASEENERRNSVALEQVGTTVVAKANLGTVKNILVPATDTKCRSVGFVPTSSNTFKWIAVANGVTLV
jgi:hypothetical protein